MFNKLVVLQSLTLLSPFIYLVFLEETKICSITRCILIKLNLMCEQKLRIIIDKMASF